MSEPAATDFAAEPAVGATQVLSDDAIEAVLADFRAWLRALPASNGAVPPLDDGPDLHTLLGQFTALRHEVNLQTRAVRAQQEQNAATLDQLTQTLSALEQARASADASQQTDLEDVHRPLLKTLVELYDALALGGREVQRTADSLGALLEAMSPATDVAEVADEQEQVAPLVVAVPAPSWWRRLFGATTVDVSAMTNEITRLRTELRHERTRRREESQRTRQLHETLRAGAERARQVVASLAEGYAMSLQRIERALAQHGLEAIIAIGVTFDPEQMEVVEATMGSGRPSGEVLQEVRRGYLWNGRVFRYAQVRVAKG
jgi:molecular chaperone GrpE